MEITMQNRNNPIYEALLDDLIQETFGFSFKPWYALKLWNELYESYSIIANDRMLANACIFKMDVQLAEKSLRMHQFGGVAVRKECRGQGLARRLMEYILAKYADVPAVLFANPSVLDFYPKFGFRRIFESNPVLVQPVNNPHLQAIKLACDDAKLLAILHGRGVYSHILDVTNTQSVQRFHQILEYTEDIYYLPELDAAVVAVQDGATLLLVDVIAPKPLLFSDLVAQLPFKGVEKIVFGFCPDWLGVTPTWVKEEDDNTAMFVSGNVQFPEQFKFPLMSMT